MDGFRSFLLRGNVVDLAVAVVVGAAFGALVTSFVAAFITPLVGVFTGAAGDFSEKTFSIGSTEFPYGQFISALISFLIIAAVVYFLIVKPYTVAKERYYPAEETGTPADVALLTEIRDLLARQQGGASTGTTIT